METLAPFMENLGTIVTKIIGWVPDVANMIIGNPLTLLPVGLMIGGACFGFLGRASRRS